LQKPVPDKMVSLCTFAMLEFAHAACKFKIWSFLSMIFVYNLNHML
jgi:hypothetical protein